MWCSCTEVTAEVHWTQGWVLLSTHHAAGSVSAGGGGVHCQRSQVQPTQLSAHWTFWLHPCCECLNIYHYSTKMCKQVPSHPQPYQKIPDIYLLRSVPLSICTFINCLFLSFSSYTYYAFYTDILCPSVVVSLLAIVLFYCAVWSLNHQVE